MTLTNNYTHSTTVVSVTLSAAQFSYSGPSLPITLAPGTSLTASVTFLPTAAQAYAGTLVFMRASGWSTTVPLSGTGIQTLAQAPAITSQPVSQTVTAGQSASFSVAATGAAPLTYQWNKNGAAISGATSSTYTTPATTTSDNGALFSAVATNSAGTATSTGATLTVSAAAVAPSITTQPVSQTVTTGQAATFTVAATGTAPLTYQWNKNGTAVSGATSSTYTTPGTTTSDNAAQFTAVASNSAGSATSTAATLTVNAPAVAPSITTQPSSQTVPAGQIATFAVAATGTAPLTYQWKKNGTAISGATSSTYTTPATTTSDNAAQFTVGVTNSAGSQTSTAATLTITSFTVSAAPSSFSFSATVGGVAPSSQSVTIDDTTPGPLPFTLSADQPWITLSANSGTTKAVMQFGVNPAGLAAGNYTGHVLVTASGVVNSPLAVPVTLVVSSSTVVAPSITTQPASQTVVAGKTATFTVAATGTAPMTYQWKKNGTAISGATSSTYTTPATTTSDNAAQFTVGVTNSTGSATSSAATLTVNALTALLNASSTSLSFGSVSLSTTSSQNVTLTNAGNSDITISNVIVSGAGFNASGVPTGLILTPGQAAILSATFTPAATGSVTGNVTVTSNASNSPGTIVLSGTGLAQVNHSVSLSWTPSTSTVIGYHSYSSTVSGGPYVKLTTTPVPTTSYTDTTVQSGKTYYYVVTAVDSKNMESAFSTESSAIVP